MDSIDKRILRLLQEDASMPLAEIAERVHLSQTPCWRRIQKLKAGGDRKSTRLNSSHVKRSRMPSSA